MIKTYYWGVRGSEEKELDLQADRWQAALVRGYRYDRFHRVMSDLGAAVVAISGPVDLYGDAPPEFADYPAWEMDSDLSMVTFRAAQGSGGPDLPPTEQRLLLCCTSEVAALPAIGGRWAA